MSERGEDRVARGEHEPPASAGGANPYASPIESDLAEAEPAKPCLSRRKIYGAIAVNVFGSLFLWGAFCFFGVVASDVVTIAEGYNYFLNGVPLVLLVCIPNTWLYLLSQHRKVRRQASEYSRAKLMSEAARPKGARGE